MASANALAVDPTLDLEDEIQRLKKSMNAVILAHYYQESEIQDVADFVGDSLALAQQAAKTTADVIVFCGVHFMAETAKILNPTKQVLLPDLDAGCSLSDRCPAPAFRAFVEKHPNAFVVSYVNSSAAVKALSDVIVTSSNADKIVAQPGTITGSIGVYAGKFVTTGLWDKVGVNFETITTARNAALFGTDQPFDEQQLQKLNAELDRIYADFTQKAAAGRKLPLEKLEAAAKGRVWSGEDAKAQGLVDELGGFATAIKLAKEAAKIPADADVRIELFPKPKSPVEALLAAVGGKREGDNSESEGDSAGIGIGAELQSVRTVYANAVRLGLLPRSGVLTAPISDVQF